jgi:hypothetical protein
MGSFVRISRKRRYLGKIIPFRVFLDNREIAILWNGQQTSHSISPGHHTIYIKDLWGVQSNPVDVELR